MDKNCTSPELKDRQIQNEIIVLAGNMETLTAKITILDSRLTPALRDEPASENKEDGVGQTLVPLAAAIRQARHSVEAQTTILVSILDRLEM